MEGPRKGHGQVHPDPRLPYARPGVLRGLRHEASVMDTVREMVKPLTSMDLLKEYRARSYPVGGNVGGYITFSGAHRIIDAGITGKENLSQISRGSINGIAIRLEVSLNRGADFCIFSLFYSAFT